jgi:hypothetical protein
MLEAHRIKYKTWSYSNEAEEEEEKAFITSMSE